MLFPELLDARSGTRNTMTSFDVAADLAALAAGAACFAQPRDLIVAAGPDTTRFLHGQLTQNVETLVDGATAWTLLLQPNGRLIALVRLNRVDADTIVIDVEAGHGQAAHSALSRFLIRTKCTLTLHTDVPGFRTLRQPLEVDRGARLVPCFPWPGWLTLGTDSHTDRSAPTDVSESNQVSPSSPLSPPDGLRVVSPEAAEVWRVVHGEPRFGIDLTGSTIPSETGLQACAIAFGKGCYTGQELVERIDSRGRIVRSLVRLRSTGELVPGASLSDTSGADRGVVTSAVFLPDQTWAGIGLVRNAEAIAVTADGSALTVLDLVDPIA